jgi:hypothetical protein
MNTLWKLSIGILVIMLFWRDDEKKLIFGKVVKTGLTNLPGCVIMLYLN